MFGDDNEGHSHPGLNGFVAPFISRPGSDGEPLQPPALLSPMCLSVTCLSYGKQENKLLTPDYLIPS